MNVVGRHDRPRDLVFLNQTRPRDRASLAPEPDTIRRFLARSYPFLVERMIAQDEIGRIHQLAENIGSITFR